MLNVLRRVEQKTRDSKERNLVGVQRVGGTDHLCKHGLPERSHRGPTYATDGRVRLEGTDPDRFPTKDLIIFRRIEESLPSFLFEHSPR